MDFDKSTTASKLAGANASQRRASKLLAAALADRRLRSLTLKAHEALDPDVPDLIWGARATGLYLKRGPKIMRRWTAKLPAGSIRVARDGNTTVWIATNEGLVEFPIPEAIAQLSPTPAPAARPVDPEGRLHEYPSGARLGSAR